MEIKQHTYTAIFDEFTPKTYILIVSTDPGLSKSLFNKEGDRMLTIVVSLADNTEGVKQAIEKARPVFASLPGVSLGSR
jgi:hypothetical protein